MAAAVATHPGVPAPTLWDGIFSFPADWGTADSDGPWAENFCDLFGTALDGFAEDATLLKNAAPPSKEAQEEPTEQSAVASTEEATYESLGREKTTILRRSISTDSVYTDDEDEVGEEDEEEWTEHSEGRRGRGGVRRRWNKRHVGGDSVGREGPTKRRKPAAKRDGPVRAVEGGGAARAKTTLWRKYGQKNLRGKPWRGVIRGYYKCHHPNCPAKKLVERHQNDPDKVVEVKYEAAHNHPIPESEREDAGTTSSDPPSSPTDPEEAGDVTTNAHPAVSL